MPDSHNVMCESRLYDGLALDGFSGAIERYPPLPEGNTQSAARNEPFAVRAYPSRKAASGPRSQR